MTFGSRTFQGLNSGPAIALTSISVHNTSLSPGVRSTIFTLNSDGSISYGVSTAPKPSAWANPVAAGTGTGVWVKMVATPGDANTTLGGIASSGAWTSLASGASASFTSASSSVEGLGTYTIQFATDSAGSNIIGSATGGWDVGYTP